MTDIKIQPSSNIAAVSWYPESGRLIVAFHSGAVYAYDSVPESVAMGFTASSSAGEYLARHIKGRYSYEKV